MSSAHAWWCDIVSWQKYKPSYHDFIRLISERPFTNEIGLMRIWYDGLYLRLWTRPFDINFLSESRSWRQLVHSFSLLHILWRNPSESVRSQFDYISAGILSSFDFSVLSGCYDNTVKIHTLTGKELLTLPAHSAPVRCLCWISSGIVFCLWKRRAGSLQLKVAFCHLK